MLAQNINKKNLWCKIIENIGSASFAVNVRTKTGPYLDDVYCPVTQVLETHVEKYQDEEKKEM